MRCSLLPLQRGARVIVPLGVVCVSVGEHNGGVMAGHAVDPDNTCEPRGKSIEPPEKRPLWFYYFKRDILLLA